LGGLIVGLITYSKCVSVKKYMLYNDKVVDVKLINVVNEEV